MGSNKSQWNVETTNGTHVTNDGEQRWLIWLRGLTTQTQSTTDDQLDHYHWSTSEANPHN